MILTKFLNNPRQRAPEELAHYSCLENREVICCQTPEEALAQAKLRTTKEGVIVICGSFFLAAEMLPLLKK